MLCGLSTWLRRAPALTLALCVVLGGCGYTSEYVPPNDGRARPMWREDDVVFEPAGAAISEECVGEMLRLTETRRLRLPPEYLANGYWAPRFYGPPIIIITPGIAPLLPVPPLFLPPERRTRPGFTSSFSGGSLSGWHGGGGGGHGGGGGGHGGGGGDGKGLVYLAVVALMVLPAVDLGLALARPESETKSSQAIDQVNAFNDLARIPGSPCSYYDAAPMPPGGQP